MQCLKRAGFKVFLWERKGKSCSCRSSCGIGRNSIAEFLTKRTAGVDEIDRKRKSTV